MSEFIKNGINFKDKGDNIYSILKPSFENELIQFLQVYELISEKEAKTIIPKAEYQSLPFSKTVQNNAHWKFRTAGFYIAQKELANIKSANILEIAGWNGWLTHHLAKDNKVISCDYFIDDVNGLGSKKYYKEQWLALQTDISKLDCFNRQFDVIVVNHCLQYHPEPMKYVDHLKQLLQPQGKMLILGLVFNKNSKEKAEEVERFKQYYKDKYQFNIFLKPNKAFLDFTDRNELIHKGIKLKQYSAYFKSNLLSKVLPHYPLYEYGIFQHKQ